MLQDLGKNIDPFKRLDKPKLVSAKKMKLFVSTRKRLYENQKYKNSSQLLPDTHSTDEHLKQADLQTFI